MKPVGLKLKSITLFFAFAGRAVAPYERAFHCNDEAIQKPFQPNTIGLKHLLVISLASPFFVICLVEAVLFSNSEGSNRLAKFFTTSTLVYLKYLLVYALCTFIMEFLKCSVGRLRPHFLAACQPDWTRMDCTTDPNAIIEPSATYCLNPDRHRVRTARTSFPSGHTAAAVHVWLFVAIYLCRMAKITGIKRIYLLRNILLTIFTIWTVITAITRVTDNWHHPSDVLGGCILALSCVIPAFGNQWKTYDSVYHVREIEKPRPKFE